MNLINKIVIILCFLLFLISCSQTNEEKRVEAVHSAKIYLTKRLCDDALRTLLAVGVDVYDVKYMQALSSAYACKSDYSTIVFYGTNLEKIAATSSDALLGSLSTFTTSLMTSPNDKNYLNLLNAINILLYAGELSDPSSANRSLVFKVGEVLDINIQILYMILTQMGKFAFYYGNADPVLGKKGLGSDANGNPNNLSNGCFYDYDPVDATFDAIITAERLAGNLGSCTNTATGHPQLAPLPNANTVERMCQGIILFNIFLDIIMNTSLPTDAGDLQDLSTIFETVLDVIPAGMGNIASVTSQSVCEETYSVGSETDKLQMYFYFIYERLFL